jgi:hypothetical protein
MKPAAAGKASNADSDDLERLLHAQRLKDGPERLRSHTPRVAQPDVVRASEPGLVDKLVARVENLMQSAQQEPATLYRYRNAAGRTVYTNLPDTVPRDQQSNAPIDLHAVSLNPELGADLDRQLAARHRALQTAPICQHLRSAAQAPWWSHAWGERAPLVVCGGALLLAALLTPWMLRKGWGASWARVLSTATPVLGFVGIATFLLLQTQRSVADWHVRADRCETSSFQQASDARQRVQLVQALQAEQRALEQIHAESR